METTVNSKDRILIKTFRLLVITDIISIGIFQEYQTISFSLGVQFNGMVSSTNQTSKSCMRAGLVGSVTVIGR